MNKQSLSLKLVSYVGRVSVGVIMSFFQKKRGRQKRGRREWDEMSGRGDGKVGLGSAALSSLLDTWFPFLGDVVGFEINGFSVS